jgi:D-alanine-D-alanine ligase
MEGIAPAFRELGTVLPANLGSSVGVCKIHNESEFEEALRYSAQYDRKILIEKGIDGREIECAILGNDDPKASVTGEVISTAEFYDYDAKYVTQESRLEIPAQIDDKKAEEIRNMAVQSFKIIDGSGLARVDFFLERVTGKVWIRNNVVDLLPSACTLNSGRPAAFAFEELMRRPSGEERPSKNKEISGR